MKRAPSTTWRSWRPSKRRIRSQKPNDSAYPCRADSAGIGHHRSKDIDLEAIAWTRKAVVNFRPMDRCEATIIGSQRRAVISVNRRSLLEWRRFSLAHELGHWHHHRGQVLFCANRDVGNFANDALNPGRQADSFTSDPILPNYLVDPRLRKMKRLTLAAARDLAGEFTRT
jgi:hypothetical protein